MKISGYTKPFAVLGHPIGHTLSPVMHNAAIAALKRDAIYLAFDVHPDRLLTVLTSMKDLGFGGANLTIPHKEVAYRGLSRLDESAQLLGAVNTVKFDADGITGFNTDGYGFLRAVEEAFGKSVKGDSIFIVGGGGAGRAVALMAAKAGAKSITLADLDTARCEKITEEIKKQFPGVETRVSKNREEQLQICRTSDLVVHSTPIGMKKEDKSVLGPEAFRSGQRVFDLIYMYPETVFMKEALKAGAKAANGLGMLLYQGVKAFEIWTGVEPPVDVMRNALEEVVYPK